MAKTPKPVSAPRLTEGVRLLCVEMRERKWDRVMLAEKLGLTSGEVSNILRGVRGVGADRSMHFRDALGIPMEAWRIPPKRPFTLPTRSGKAA